MLACVGGAAGLLLAAWGVSLLTGTAVDRPAARAEHRRRLAGRAVRASACRSLTGVVFGLVPARAGDAAYRHPRVIERGGPRQVGQRPPAPDRDRRSSSPRSALALVLLVGAGLLLRSFSALTRVSPGFNAEQPAGRQPAALAAQLQRRRRADRGRRTHRRAGARAARGPGRRDDDDAADGGGRRDDSLQSRRLSAEGPGRLRDGRLPRRHARAICRRSACRCGAAACSPSRDREGAPPVVVINESMARQYFPDRDPLGQRIQLGTEPSPDFPTMEVVGVVGDMKQSFEAASKAEMFVPYGQFPDPDPAGHVPQHRAGRPHRRRPGRPDRRRPRRSCARSIRASRWSTSGRWKWRWREPWRSRGCR